MQSLWVRFRRLSLWNKIAAAGAVASIFGLLVSAVVSQPSEPTVVQTVSNTGSGTIVLAGVGDATLVTRTNAPSTEGGLPSQESSNTLMREPWESTIGADGCVVSIVDAVTTIGGRHQPQDYYVMERLGEFSTISKSSYASRAKFGLPAIDIKLVNNCRETVFFSELRFNNVSSTLDGTPEISIAGANFGVGDKSVVLRNAGWGSAKGSALEGVLNSSVHGAREIKIPLGDIALKTTIDASQLLRDVFGEANLPEGEQVSFRGALSYSYETSSDETKQISKVVGFSIINELPTTATQVPPTYYYDVAFEESRSAYRRKVAISHALTAGDFDRFVITLASAKSSIHRFDLVLAYNGDRTAELGSYQLDFYFPRWAVTRLKGTSPR